MSQSFIPLSVPNLGGKELEYVTNAVSTGWVSTAGKYVSDFENAVANYVHTHRAVACQSGTAGLHVSLLLSGVEAGDAVIVPTLTFIAAVNPVRYVHATPIFMDCDDSLCMDPEKLAAFCERECDFDGKKLIWRKTGQTVKTVVVVHVFGNMANMARILEIARKYGLKVIEDATEALGTHYDETHPIFPNRFAGTMGDFGVFSFNGNKIITTGGGGMILAANVEDAEHAKHLTTQAKSDEQNFLHDEVGFNYRLTNLQAALGLAQLEQLEGFIATKARNYADYCASLADMSSVRMLGFEKNVRSNYWFYSLFIEDPKAFNRDAVIAEFGKNSIQTRPIWGLIHEQLPYEGSATYEIEKAIYYAERVVNLPCSTNLTSEDVARVVEVTKRIFQ